MTKYIQTNQNGYIFNITNEPLLVRLFGSSLKDYRAVSDNETNNIEKLLQAAHRQ